jgi:hypothetical protein
MSLILPDSPIIYRHITILPGEDLSFTEKLSDYVSYDACLAFTGFESPFLPVC